MKQEFRIIIDGEFEVESNDITASLKGLLQYKEATIETKNISENEKTLILPLNKLFALHKMLKEYRKDLDKSNDRNLLKRFGLKMQAKMIDKLLIYEDVDVIINDIQSKHEAIKLRKLAKEDEESDEFEEEFKEFQKVKKDMPTE